MTKPLVPADLLKTVTAADKPTASSGPAAKVKAQPAPKGAVKASSKPQGKGGVAHTRMSNRGK